MMMMIAKVYCLLSTCQPTLSIVYIPLASEASKNHVGLLRKDLLNIAKGEVCEKSQFRAVAAIFTPGRQVKRVPEMLDNIPVIAKQPMDSPSPDFLSTE